MKLISNDIKWNMFKLQKSLHYVAKLYEMKVKLRNKLLITLYISLPTIIFLRFMLAQKALQLPGFSTFSIQCFWTDWQSFFYLNPWLIFCNACNPDRPDSPVQMDFKPENKSLLPIFHVSLFLTTVTIVHGWKHFCLGWMRLETLVEEVIKLYLPVSNFC